MQLFQIVEVNAYFESMKRRSSRGQRVLGGLLVAIVVSWMLSLMLVVLFGRPGPLQKADAIVVLGAAQWAGRPSPVLESRLTHAIDLWKKGLAPLLILTGGPGKGDVTTEAEVGRKFALAKGVPDNAIVVENRGRTTSESLRTVAAMLKVREKNRTILVSDSFHMLRLRILARRFGLHCFTSPAPDSPIAASPSRYWRYVLSESVKAPLALIME